MFGRPKKKKHYVMILIIKETKNKFGPTKNKKEINIIYKVFSRCNINNIHKLCEEEYIQSKQF